MAENMSSQKTEGKLKKLLSGKKGRRWIVLCVLAVAVIGGGTAFLSRTRAKAAKAETTYTTASVEKRPLFTDVLTRVAQRIFIPLTVGGSINSVADFDRVLKAGADKVSVNSGAIAHPELIDEAAKKYGNQCVVLSIDAKRVDGQYRVFAKGGRVDTGMDALEWAAQGEARGAGELVLNSIDTDGVKRGFDLEMLAAVAARVKIPIIASGGAGRMEDFKALFALEGVDAGLAASIFHFREIEIMDLKRYLAGCGVNVRM